jgi:insertion element IS1 protein InsB
VTSGFEVENPQPPTGNGHSGFSTSKAYQAVFPKDTHQAWAKEAGQTNQVEWWNNTLRQRRARFVRKTLSFSKSLAAHRMFTKWFIFLYTLDCLSSCT